MHIEVFEQRVVLTKENLCNISNETCSQCKGTCCKNMGCHISPRDLKDLSRDGIIDIIEQSGCISIDWWDGPTPECSYDKGFYLRIRNKDAPIIDSSYGGECILLGDDGCMLSYCHRPMGGRELIPNMVNECESLYTKEQCVQEWLEYHDLLNSVYLHLQAVEHGVSTLTLRELIKMVGEMKNNEV